MTCRKLLTIIRRCDIIVYVVRVTKTHYDIMYAGMAELADALASGASGGNPVEVQVLLPAFFMLVFKTGIFFVLRKTVCLRKKRYKQKKSLTLLHVRL